MDTLSAFEGGYMNEEIAHAEIPSEGHSEPITDEQKQQFIEEQIEGRIREAILSFDKIEECSVSIRIGNKSLAEVILSLNDIGVLSESEVQSIAVLIKGIVPDLEDENILISQSVR